MQCDSSISTNLCKTSEQRHKHTPLAARNKEAPPISQYPSNPQKKGHELKSPPTIQHQFTQPPSSNSQFLPTVAVTFPNVTVASHEATVSIWVARSAKHFGSWNPFRSRGSPERSKRCVSADASRKFMVKYNKTSGNCGKKSCSKWEFGDSKIDTQNGTYRSILLSHQIESILYTMMIHHFVIQSSTSGVLPVEKHSKEEIKTTTFKVRSSQTQTITYSAHISLVTYHFPTIFLSLN